MKQKNKQTLRFAFGTEEEPGSSVWRINVAEKSGNIYLNNSPQMGASVHISLHASGNFSFKLGNDRHKLQPPFKDELDNYWGPIIFSRKWARNIPPPMPSGKLKFVKWLGWPTLNSMFIVKFIYSNIDSSFLISNNEQIIFPSIRAKIFHTDMILNVVLQENLLTEKDVRTIAENKPEFIDFQGSNPLAIEYLRISKTDFGPSAIIHDSFETSK